ncbi:unnamed protein product [Linum trigynum]|uniref:Uncharacterized protein n=1 Tax=Linum trigynum TaxID=586398 RepID=A0AAV2F3I7_9ROSI
MSLVAGSNERFIWGFKLKPVTSEQSLTLVPLFSYPSHQSAILSAAAACPIAASGSSDDTIHLYDLPSAASLGSLYQHTASVTALSFYTPPSLSFPRNLISADAEGYVCIFDADPFVHLKTVRAHQFALLDSYNLPHPPAIRQQHQSHRRRHRRLSSPIRHPPRRETAAGEAAGTLLTAKITF